MSSRDSEENKIMSPYKKYISCKNDKPANQKQRKMKQGASSGHIP